MLKNPYPDTSEYIFRTLTPADAPAFACLLRELDDGTRFMLFEPGERSGPGSERQIDIGATNRNGVLFGAFQDKRLVGYLSGEAGIAHRNRHVLYLVIGVAPSHQGRHVGTGLFQSVEAWASAHAIHRMELTVVVANTPAISLYRARGFKVEGTRRHSMLIDGHLHDEFYMAKLL